MEISWSQINCNLHLLSTCCFVPLQDGIYTLPCHLSMQARDLITRILKADPLHRITIPEIRGHPWFRVQLPLYLGVPPPEYTQQLKRVIFFSSVGMLSLMRLGWFIALFFTCLFVNIWAIPFFSEHAWSFENCTRQSYSPNSFLYLVEIKPRECTCLHAWNVVIVPTHLIHSKEVSK